MAASKHLLSVIVPCYNESGNIAPFHNQLASVLNGLEPELVYELLYINDGSTDTTQSEISDLEKSDHKIRLITLSRNFGKEIAITAGMHHAKGSAVLSIDGDGQHPVELIPEFVKAWQEGNQVVVGMRSSNQGEGIVKRLGSKLFYRLINNVSGSELAEGSTDFCLIDRVVQAEFIKLTEHGRMTRGLIDWLGFKRTYISFEANPRLSGPASYSVRKLFHLAVNGFLSVSLTPLYFSLYTGLIILPLSVIMGVFCAFEMLIGDPLGLNIHGTAFVAILILFSVGLLLVSQGFTALYLSKVHTETQNRPLFVVDKTRSHGI